MNAIRAIFSAVLFAGLLGYAFYAVMPGLIRDWTLRDHYAVVPGDVNGECSGRTVIYYCSVTLTPGNGGAPQKEEMFFVDFDTGPITVSLVASPDNPSVMSTSIGVEKYWNRVLTLIVLGLVGVLIIIGSLMDLFKKKEPQPA